MQNTFNSRNNQKKQNQWNMFPFDHQQLVEQALRLKQTIKDMV